jgi:hypothetical protein
MNKTYRCAWCFELNEIFVDMSAGLDQVYTEECEACDHPNTIHVHIDPDTLHIIVEAEAEG